MKLSPLWLAICAALALPAWGAESFSAQNAKQADTSRWGCDVCETIPDRTANVNLGVGYVDNGGSPRFNNWVPTGRDQGAVAALNGNVANQDESGNYQLFEVRNLGFERFLLRGEIGNYQGVRLGLSYSEHPYYWNNNSLTPYTGSNNVQVLDSDFRNFEKSVKRKVLGLNLSYEPDSPWTPYADMKLEQKQGTQASYISFIPGFGYAPSYLAKPIDQQTLNSQAGIKYRQQDWGAEITYRGSVFRNDHSVLYYGETGNVYSNQHSYEPDNDFHQLSLLGDYRATTQSLNSRLQWSQSTSDAGLTQYPQAPIMQNNFKGKINTWSFDANYLNRLSNKSTLKVKLDYLDRDDKSDTNALVGIQRVDYDRSQSKALVALNHKLSRSLRLDGGYQYRRDKRQYADREMTQNNQVYFGARYRPVGDWQLGAKLLYDIRSGSNWSYASSSPNLRKFYLADRDRLESRIDASYDLTQTWQVTLDAWLANERYPKPDIGTSFASDMGYDLGVNWVLLGTTSGYAYLNQQRIQSEQQHANSNASDYARFQSELTDNITTIGVGIADDTLLESRLRLSFDYSYSDGRGRTETNGGGYQYPDNDATSHRAEIQGRYQLTEQQTLHLDMRYERFSEFDYLYSQDQATMGDINQNYNGYFAFVGWGYRF
ncbi:MtrB/PioB family decaheme-associated outer membrane protein [Vibrio mediterranei]|uniref:MtrB/PioB family decaheme-associated outer membrane protein n=1 Tax=Vibrio mediterranei TaxID=689 RepID=UPI0040695301